MRMRPLQGDTTAFLILFGPEGRAGLAHGTGDGTAVSVPASTGTLQCWAISPALFS